MNYESEFQAVLVDALMASYGIDDEVALHTYYQLRYQIWKLGKEKLNYISDIRLQAQFLVEELNLPMEEGRMKYKGKWILAGFSLENSLQNILETWNFEYSIKPVMNDKGISFAMKDYIEAEWKVIKRKASNKAKPYKKTGSYIHHLQFYALKTLNEVFNATPTSPPIIPHIDYPFKHHPFKRTMEESTEMQVISEQLRRTDTLTIQERDVEDYLIFHLDKIEDGLKYVSHQTVIPEGRIDLVARDKDNTYVIIELKVTEDKELVWQCIYYPDALKKEWSLKKVRMIALAPSFSPSLLSTLKQIPNVEIMTFTPYVERSILKDMKIERLI